MEEGGGGGGAFCWLSLTLKVKRAKPGEASFIHSNGKLQRHRETYCTNIASTGTAHTHSRRVHDNIQHNKQYSAQARVPYDALSTLHKKTEKRQSNTLHLIKMAANIFNRK